MKLLALAQTSLYLDSDNHLVKYLISLNLNSLNKKKLAIEYVKVFLQTAIQAGTLPYLLLNYI